MQPTDSKAKIPNKYHAHFTFSKYIIGVSSPSLTLSSENIICVTIIFFNYFILYYLIIL